MGTNEVELGVHFNMYNVYGGPVVMPKMNTIFKIYEKSKHKTHKKNIYHLHVKSNRK
jgi:hypothetical protein